MSELQSTRLCHIDCLLRDNLEGSVRVVMMVMSGNDGNEW